MKYFTLFLLAIISVAFTACSDSDDSPAELNITETGTFTDPRDNTIYHWVRVGSTDWACENLAYDLDSANVCTIYLNADDASYYRANDYYLAKYGRLYTYPGALEAIPDGWRLPTDADWKNLETAAGSNTKNLDEYGWRGKGAELLMSTNKYSSRLALLLGGYYTNHINMYSPNYTGMGSYGFYWTSTADTTKGNNTYRFYRKLAYNRNDIYRESTEAERYFFSVRFVRDAK